jgi:hypothetical protein
MKYLSISITNEELIRYAALMWSQLGDGSCVDRAMGNVMPLWMTHLEWRSGSFRM